MRKLLIFHPFLATYRVSVYNRYMKNFNVKVLLTGGKKELDNLGFDLNKVNKQAQFDYIYYNKGFYLGRHLMSTIYYRLIKNFKPDILFAHEYGVNTLFAIFFKPFFNYKLFITCDDSLDMASTYSKMRKWLRTFVIQRLDGMVVVSEDTQRYLKSIYPKSKCSFIYFPIIQDDKVLEQDILKASEISTILETKYSLENKNVLLFVGRLDSVKNIPLLLNAFSKIEGNSILVIVGDGVEKDEIQRNIESLKIKNRVIMTGAQYGNELYAWFYYAPFFVLPSKRECFGAVVNEALVAGCKCIVSDSAGAACLIDDKNGFVFRSGDEKDLEEKLRILLSSNQTIKEHKNRMSCSFDFFYHNLVSYME